MERVLKVLDKLALFVIVVAIVAIAFLAAGIVVFCLLLVVEPLTGWLYSMGLVSKPVNPLGALIMGALELAIAAVLYLVYRTREKKAKS